MPWETTSNRPRFEVHRGDVIRFVLKSGVHNVHFLADSNPGKNNLARGKRYASAA